MLLAESLLASLRFLVSESDSRHPSGRLRLEGGEVKGL